MFSTFQLAQNIKELNKYYNIDAKLKPLLCPDSVLSLCSLDLNETCWALTQNKLKAAGVGNVYSSRVDLYYLEGVLRIVFNNSEGCYSLHQNYPLQLQEIKLHQYSKFFFLNNNVCTTDCEIVLLNTIPTKCFISDQNWLVNSKQRV